MYPRFLTAVPVYNEQSHLISVLSEVRKYCQDVLVVDDGSTDRTPLLLAEMDEVAVRRHPQNLGYGAALKTAFEYTIEQGYDALVTIDCDGQHQPRLIPAMVKALFPDESAPLDLVSGSRYLQELAEDTDAPLERKRINATITKQINACFGLHLTDTFCGFKAYHLDALKKFEITEYGYAMPLQLWVQVVRHEMRIVEFPVPRIYLDENRSFGGNLDDAHRRLAHYREVLRREMETREVPCGAASGHGFEAH